MAANNLVARFLDLPFRNCIPVTGPYLPLIVTMAERLEMDYWKIPKQEGDVDIFAFLQRIFHGVDVYDMDSYIFVQLFTAAQDWQREGRSGFIFHAPRSISAETAVCQKIVLGQPGVVIIRPENDSFVNALQRRRCAYQSIWAIDLKDGNYLALTETGLKVATLQEWAIMLRTKLQMWAKSIGDGLMERVVDCPSMINEWMCFNISKIEKFTIPEIQTEA
jgi:hypothetical protein